MNDDAVYLARCPAGGAIKIGVSGDPAERVKALRHEHPWSGLLNRPVLVDVIEGGGEALERGFHDALASLRIGPGREWFLGSDSVVRLFEFIKELGHPGARILALDHIREGLEREAA